MSGNSNKNKYIIGFSLASGILITYLGVNTYLKRQNSLFYQYQQFQNKFYKTPKMKLQSMKKSFVSLVQKFIDKPILKKMSISDPKFNKPIFCGNPLKYLDTFYECCDCSQYQEERRAQGNNQRPKNSQIFCQGCYDKSKHEGHEVKTHKNLQRGNESGFCDCGDYFDLKASSICDNHQRPTDKELQEYNVQQDVLEMFKNNIQDIFYLYFKQVEKYMIDQTLDQKNDHLNVLTEIIIKYLETITNHNLVTAYNFTNILTKPFSKNKNYKFYHSCDNNKNKKDVIYYQKNKSKILQELPFEEKEHECSCSIFENILKISKYFNQNNQQLLQKLLTRWMVISLDFRIHFGYAVLKHFRLLIQEKQHTAQSGVQYTYYVCLEFVELLTGSVCREQVAQGILDAFGGSLSILEEFLFDGLTQMDLKSFFTQYNSVLDLIIENVSCFIDNDTIVKQLIVNKKYVDICLDIMFCLEKGSLDVKDINELQTWLIDQSGINQVVIQKGVSFLMYQIRHKMFKNIVETDNTEYLNSIKNLYFNRIRSLVDINQDKIKLCQSFSEILVDLYMIEVKDYPSQTTFEKYISDCYEIVANSTDDQAAYLSIKQNLRQGHLVPLFSLAMFLYLRQTISSGISEIILEQHQQNLRQYPQAAQIYDFALDIIKQPSRGEYDRDILMKQVLLMNQKNQKENQLFPIIDQILSLDIDVLQHDVDNRFQYVLPWMMTQNLITKIFLDETVFINIVGAKFSNIQIKDKENARIGVQNLYKKIIIMLLQFQQGKAVLKEIQQNIKSYLFDWEDQDQQIKEVIESVADYNEKQDVYFLKSEFENNLHILPFSRDSKKIRKNLENLTKFKNIKDFDLLLGNEEDIIPEFEFTYEIRSKFFGNRNLIEKIHKLFDERYLCLDVPFISCMILIERFYIQIYELYQSKKNFGRLTQQDMDDIKANYIYNENISKFFNCVIEKDTSLTKSCQNLLTVLERAQKL